MLSDPDISGAAGAPATQHLRPVQVVGHPFAPIGMGEHARSVWRALSEIIDDVGIVDIYRGAGGVDDPAYRAAFSQVITENLGDGVNIFCINGDEVEDSFTALRDRNLGAPGARNVVYPAWELEHYPEEWAKQLSRFNEVWAPSSFIRDAIAKVVDIPVIHMPLACEVKGRALVPRSYFGIRESAYVFLTAFDFLSYVDRKNPFAVIEAFSRVLARRPYADTLLVVKTNNSDRRPETKARFEKAIAGIEDRIIVIDRTLRDDEMKALMWLSDCFVSLHRSEGFGRGLSEAMALGRPVVTTAYSGNMDFCTPETAFLIPYELIPVQSGQYPHWENQHWAEPDIDAAAKAMASLLDDPEVGRQMGRRARHHIAAEFSFLAAGVRYMERSALLTAASLRESK